MFVPFEELDKSSKIWIYQANRSFNGREEERITEYLSGFIKAWETHGQPVKGSFKLFYNQFIIIAADESYNPASGCSIDKVFKTINQLEKELDIVLLDRSLIAFKTDSSIKICSLKDIPALIAEETLKPTTPVFNNTIVELHELANSWELPAKDTWISKYFNK